MIKLIDMHLHSEFSPDSKQSVKAYFESEEVEVLTFTDHLDFWQSEDKRDAVMDYTEYLQKTKKYQEQTEIKFYTGIEVGYHSTVKKQTLDYLQDKQFDIIILSIHQDGQQDYLYTSDEYIVDIDYYLENLLDGINSLEYITTIGHLDYPFRNNKFDPNFWNNLKLMEVLDQIVEKDIALEVNTRSLYEFGNFDFYSKLLEVYASRGGTRLSLGSDGHKIDKYRFHFEDSLELINRVGIFEVINYDYCK